MKESIRNTHYFLSFFPLFLQIKKNQFFLSRHRKIAMLKKNISQKKDLRMAALLKTFLLLALVSIPYGSQSAISKTALSYSG